ncbi:MAG TPA: DNA primase [Chloroflexia bacterium]|nr:DNA primase [Chloroflexia bacterium]
MVMEGYVPNYIEEIKRRLSIVDVVGQRVNLKKSGKNYKGLCPFHAEKSGSFYVWPESESYYCFGCKESGDIFNFIMKTEGLGFSEALEQLASRAGIILPERQPNLDQEAKARKGERERLREANNSAATYFQHLLLNSKEGQAARQYLEKRGVSAAAIESFGLGYAADSWDNLFNYLTGKGFTPQELLDAGLTGERENDGGYYDRFRGRLMFPIRDRQGQVIAFGGRVLENAPKDAPKYLNSPQTVLFDKSATLYGLDLAKESIRRSDRAVIVEGYLDVIMAHQYGYSNVIAPLGTALGEKHIGILKKLTKRIVLALDADTAGELATLKGIEVLKQGFDSKTVAVPTARGLIRFEQQLDADVRIASLPAGKDPDEVVREGGGKWRELIERALPVVDYYFASVAASVDINSARGKSEAVEKLIPAILEVRDRIQREHYIQKLARLTRIEDSLLRGELNRAAKAEIQKLRNQADSSVAQPKPEAEADPEVKEENEPEEKTAQLSKEPARPLDLEDLMLAFLTRYYQDAMSVEAADGQVVEAADFTRSENRLIFEGLQTLEKGQRRFDELEESFAPELAEHLQRLQAHAQNEPELTDLMSIQEAMRFQLNRLREINLRRLYEQGSLALEEEEVNQADDNQEHLWQLVSNVSDQLKVFYPPRSVVFKDSRDR